MFDKIYYDQIWGTIHRHDYCESLANQLISKYGKCRILDIGTGCGELVRILREKGCDAWGIDVSDYAIDNSCCKEYVRKGDIRDIPFGDNRFDLIHSQGVWGYFPEADVDKAWSECRRAGKHQEHNIDVDDYDETHAYTLFKSREWWNNKLSEPKILIGSCTHQLKEYSLQRWIDNVKSFTYPNVEIFVVDNSPTEDLTNKYKSQIPIVHIDVDQSPQFWHNRITKSMAIIQEKFLAGNYYKWFNLECDVIPPKNIIEFMLEWGKDTDWISHCYPNREGSNKDVQQGIGCSMLSRKLVESFDYKQADSPDAWLWECVRKSGKFKTMELWQYINIQHLRS